MMVGYERNRADPPASAPPIEPTHFQTYTDTYCDRSNHPGGWWLAGRAIGAAPNRSTNLNLEIVQVASLNPNERGVYVLCSYVYMCICVCVDAAASAQPKATPKSNQGTKPVLLTFCSFFLLLARSLSTGWLSLSSLRLFVLLACWLPRDDCNLHKS